MSQFLDVLPMSREAATKAFVSGDKERICHALVSVAFHESDWRWAQERFLEFLQKDDASVSGLAATCLGHLARIHRVLDKERVISVLQQKKACGAISGAVEDALDDIEMFARP
jgi:hypothetical protein